MTLSEVIQDIHALACELSKLEEPYELLSDDFYRLYKTGELEQSRDFVQWVGYCEAKRGREERYRELMYEYLRTVRQRSGSAALQLDPEGTTAGGA